MAISVVTVADHRRAAQRNLAAHPRAKRLKILVENANLDVGGLAGRVGSYPAPRRNGGEAGRFRQAVAWNNRMTKARFVVGLHTFIERLRTRDGKLQLRIGQTIERSKCLEDNVGGHVR